MIRKAIINGKLVEMEQLAAVSVSSQLKGWNLDDQRSIHAREILQAHKGSKANPAFVREYPDEATRYFTPDQINEAANNYE